jgi:hypothetical protein
MARPTECQPKMKLTVLYQKCDMAVQTGSNYNSENKIDIKTIPTATHRFPVMTKPVSVQPTRKLKLSTPEMQYGGANRKHHIALAVL